MTRPIISLSILFHLNAKKEEKTMWHLWIQNTVSKNIAVFRSFGRGTGRASFLSLFCSFSHRPNVLSYSHRNPLSPTCYCRLSILGHEHKAGMFYNTVSRKPQLQEMDWAVATKNPWAHLQLELDRYGWPGACYSSFSVNKGASEKLSDKNYLNEAHS